MGRPTLGPGVIPSLLVGDMSETVAFYGALGFRLTGAYPSEKNPTWTEVRRDGVIIQLHSEAPHGTPERPVFSGTLYVRSDDVLGLAEELEGKVSFEWGPEVMPYGMRELGIKDPNGYYLAFTAPA